MAVCAVAALLAGCQRNLADSQDAASDQPASSAETGYVVPPQVVSAQRQANGVALIGRSDPDARVRLSSPDGLAYGATAGANGGWTMTAPPPDAVRLFGLSEVLGARAVQGGGYLAVLPAPGPPAILLRAGGGSEVLNDAQNAPQVAAIDYDAGGGAVVSGLAKPGLAVRLTLDGAVAGEGRPDGAGRFAIPLAGVLKPGDHVAMVQSTVGQSKTAFSITPSAPITGAPYRGARQPEGWRIDWLTPGGSAQTTLVLDPPVGPTGGALTR